MRLDCAERHKFRKTAHISQSVTMTEHKPNDLVYTLSHHCVEEKWSEKDITE